MWIKYFMSETIEESFNRITSCEVRPPKEIITSSVLLRFCWRRLRFTSHLEPIRLIFLNHIHQGIYIQIINIFLEQFYLNQGSTNCWNLGIFCLIRIIAIIKKVEHTVSKEIISIPLTLDYRLCWHGVHGMFQEDFGLNEENVWKP